jgi:excinuclease UvrABC nuclease subunit
MNGHFLEAIRSLEPSFQRLLAMAPVTPVTLPQSMPKSGIYLLSENDRHLYVGRTRNIRARIARHSRPGATHRMAAFAFRLAREATGNLAATYKKKGSRADLMESPVFRLAFDEAKKRIRAMDLRFVEENDPVRQAVLEIYVAVSLQTRCNDFDTH